jgi:hypothetical protein
MSAVSVSPANVTVSITKTDTHAIPMICRKVADNKVLFVGTKIESSDVIYVPSRSLYNASVDLSVFQNTWVTDCYEVTSIGAIIKRKSVKDVPAKAEKSPEYLELQSRYACLEKTYFELMTVGLSESKNRPAKGKGELDNCRKCNQKTYSYRSGCINKECSNKRSPKNTTKTDSSASEAPE